MTDREDKNIVKDIEILEEFFRIYCDNTHKERSREQVNPSGILKRLVKDNITLCHECKNQFLYACVKRTTCPFDPKPACKRCSSICYSEGHRIFMRRMMRFSGKYLIFHGRFELIFKYLF